MNGIMPELLPPEEKIDKILEQYPQVWKSRSAFMQYIKGLVRRGWNRAPQKLIFLKKYRLLIDNPSPKGKAKIWGAKCAICGELHPLKHIQVDHILEETAKLQKWDDLPNVLYKLLLVTEDDLRLLCKECHAIVTESQKKGISFEEARLEKIVIAFKKLSATAQTAKLTEVLTSKPEYETMLPVGKTIARRVQQYREYIRLTQKEEDSVQKS